MSANLNAEKISLVILQEQFLVVTSANFDNALLFVTKLVYNILSKISGSCVILRNVLKKIRFKLNV